MVLKNCYYLLSDLISYKSVSNLPVIKNKIFKTFNQQAKREDFIYVLMNEKNKFAFLQIL